MSDTQEFVVSNINEDQETLQARFHDLGYLLFKEYVKEDKCKALLHSFLQELSPYISYDSLADAPVYNGTPFAEMDAVWNEVYPKMQSLEQFHSFFHDGPVLELMKIVTGTDVFVYPMKMARISTPGKIGYETPPHQDAYSHHAGPTMAGIWVALHDVSRQMGRLKVLPGSHKQGVRRVFSADGVGGVQCEIFPHETTWHVSDFQRGDVLIFHSGTIHKAEPNTAQKLARISVDTRFCDHGAPVFSTNLEPHHGCRIEGLDWDRIYRGWQSKELQHYWRDYPQLF